MTFRVDKNVLERHVNKEIDELDAMGGICVEGRFALHSEDDFQVQVIVTREEDEFISEANDYTKEADLS